MIRLTPAMGTDSSRAKIIDVKVFCAGPSRLIRIERGGLAFVLVDAGLPGGAMFTTLAGGLYVLFWTLDCVRLR